MTDAARARPALDAALARLESRGLRLRRGVRPVVGRPEIERVHRPIPTGEPALDVALGCGGWPRGGVAAVAAPPGSGSTSLALGTLAVCQADGGLAAWIDTDGTFDAPGAERRSVDLRWLLVVRPHDPLEAVELAGWLCRARLLDLLVVDLGAAVPGGEIGRGLNRLGALVARTGSTVILIGSAASDAAAAVRVRLERRAWLAVARDVVGQRVEARVARTRAAPAGGQAVLDLWFAEGRRIERLLPATAEPHTDAPALDVARSSVRVLSA